LLWNRRTMAPKAAAQRVTARRAMAPSEALSRSFDQTRDPPGRQRNLYAWWFLQEYVREAAKTVPPSTYVTPFIVVKGRPMNSYPPASNRFDRPPQQTGTDTVCHRYTSRHRQIPFRWCEVELFIAEALEMGKQGADQF